MTPCRKPYVIDAVERASKHAVIVVRGELKRGLSSLAVIASTATLIGVLGTVIQIIFHTFYGCGGSWSSCMAPIGERLSEAMGLTALGLFVAILASCFHRYLSSQMEAFDMEMENSSADLTNCLLVHLRLTEPTDNIHLSPQANEISREKFARSSAPEGSLGYSMEGPRLSIKRLYRNGVLELTWPRLESEFDADSVLYGGMWVSLAYAFIGLLTYYIERRPVAGILTFFFFAFAALGLRTGSLAAILSVFIFCEFACMACVVSFGWTLSAVCLAAAPLLLTGSLKAARFSTASRISATFLAQAKWQVWAKNSWAALRPLRGVLLGVLTLSASIAVLFGTALALYPMSDDHSMEPSLNAGDWVVSINAPLIGAIRHGDLVAFPYWNTVGIERVVGLPGDRIQVKSGKLLVNDKDVAESYRKQSYSEDFGDFPLPSEALPGNFRWEHDNAYGRSFTGDKAFIVPRNSYFLLDDNRNELVDSRIFGPLKRSQIAGRPVLAYAFKNLWSFPRFIR